MKKAKIMLTAVGLMAVIGGALAFKANRAGGHWFCSEVSATTCPIIATTYLGPPGEVEKLYCTLDPNADCTTTFVVKRNL